jgi:hypothetical protein
MAFEWSKRAAAQTRFRTAEKSRYNKHQTVTTTRSARNRFFIFTADLKPPSPSLHGIAEAFLEKADLRESLRGEAAD